MGLRLHLRDLSEALVAAWRGEFGDLPDVEISQGDIFSRKSGVVRFEDGIDLRADAIVSPANSFGFMDGGIDAVFTYQLGPQVQQALQEVLREHWAGELPVGEAIIVPTGRSEIPWCVSAPTMRLPQEVSHTVNAYLAFRAALRAVSAHNSAGRQTIGTLLCPGLGTAVGRLSPRLCARQMRAAWDRVEGGRAFLPTSLSEAGRDDEWLKGR
jgi:O-acetyl-ADP-ribose deacetylase (regulator of RNase III)